MYIEDTELMQAYASGDTAAFEVLYTRHKGALYQYIINSCESESTAGELFQDIWLKVINSRNYYEPQSPFAAWLYKIARNRLIDHYRQKGRKPGTDSIDEETTDNVVSLATQSLSPEQIASLSERHDVLQSTLYELPDEQREAVLLRHVAGMTTTEISDVMGVGKETVKSRLRYAVVKLRSLLEKRL